MQAAPSSVFRLAEIKRWMKSQNFLNIPDCRRDGDERTNKAAIPDSSRERCGVHPILPADTEGNQNGVQSAGKCASNRQLADRRGRKFRAHSPTD